MVGAASPVGGDGAGVVEVVVPPTNMGAIAIALGSWPVAAASAPRVTMPLAAIAAACHLSHRFCIFPSGQDLRCFAPWRNCFALQGGLPAPPWVVLRCRWQTAESGCSRRRVRPHPRRARSGNGAVVFSTQRENFGAGIRRNTADLGRLQPALGVITYRGGFRRCAPLLCGCFVAYAWGCPPLRTLIWCFQSRNTLPQLRISRYTDAVPANPPQPLLAFL